MPLCRCKSIRAGIHCSSCLQWKTRLEWGCFGKNLSFEKALKLNSSKGVCKRVEGALWCFPRGKKTSSWNALASLFVITIGSLLVTSFGLHQPDWWLQSAKLRFHVYKSSEDIIEVKDYWKFPQNQVLSYLQSSKLGTSVKYAYAYSGDPQDLQQVV